MAQEFEAMQLDSALQQKPQRAVVESEPVEVQESHSLEGVRAPGKNSSPKAEGAVWRTCKVKPCYREYLAVLSIALYVLLSCLALYTYIREEGADRHPQAGVSVWPWQADAPTQL